MSEKFWLEMATYVFAAICALGFFMTKIGGWGPRSIQAMIIAMGIPTLIVLSLEGILNSQALCALLGVARRLQLRQMIAFRRQHRPDDTDDLVAYDVLPGREPLT